MNQFQCRRDALTVGAITKNSAVLLGVTFCFDPVAIRSDDSDLAKKLANPIASLISVPIVYDFDHNKPQWAAE